MAGRALWRIAQETPDYAAHDLSGAGAGTSGGRWNSKGNAVIYTSTSIALAVCETAIHLGAIDGPPRNRYLVRIDVPTGAWRARRVALDLPVAWDAIPAGRASVAYGDAWLASGKSLLLEVPSVVVPEESNVLIHPGHPGIVGVKATVVRKIAYDPRLLLKRG